MNWHDYATPRCCTVRCAHDEPEELSTDVSRFRAVHFLQAAALMHQGASCAEAVTIVNIDINQRTWAQGGIT